MALNGPRRRAAALLALALAALFAVASCSSSKAAPPAPETTTSASSTPASTTPATTESTPSTTPHPTSTAPKPHPAPAVDPLTGSTTVSHNPVVAAKIDNTFTGARQFGVAQADIVFVEQVEGGLTRLCAVFHTHLPTEIGPVRSVRSTDSELLQVFGKPVLVFSGGAAAQMDRLHATPIIDASNAPGYWRSDVAPAPYNLHADLTKVVASLHDLQPARPIGFTFAAHDAAVTAAPKVDVVTVQMQATTMAFSYVGGSYQVARNGTQLFDASGAAFAANNVLLLHVIDKPDGTVDALGSPSYFSSTVGGGSFTLYRNGHAITGRWARAAADKPFSFTDSSGKVVPLTPGRTWVVLAPQTSSVSTS